MGWWKRGGKRGRQFANGTEKNGVWAQDEKGGEKRDEKKKKPWSVWRVRD